jgi:SAM-dependent methyltransferase
MQTNPRDDALTLTRIYTQLTDPIYDAEDDNRRHTAWAYAQLMRRYVSPPGKLLDVGCATGVFTREAQRLGWQATGLEASGWAVARARALAPEVTWVNTPLEQAEFPALSFDVITLWDVLEHVASPTATLRRLHGWLKPNGYFFLNLPNSGSWIARLMGPRWVLLLREHVWYFAPATMRQLLEKTGFRLIRTRPNWVRFSLANIGGRLAQYTGLAGRAGQRLAALPAARHITLTFPMGEMNVAAQKSVTA